MIWEAGQLFHKKGPKRHRRKRNTTHYAWFVLRVCRQMKYRDIANYHQKATGASLGEDTIRKGVEKVAFQAGVRLARRTGS